MFPAYVASSVGRVKMDGGSAVTTDGSVTLILKARNVIF